MLLFFLLVKRRKNSWAMRICAPGWQTIMLQSARSFTKNFCTPPPSKGDVKVTMGNPKRWRRYDGKHWQMKCSEVNCNVRPCFGDPEQRIALWCAKHRKEGNQDVLNRKCEFKGCKTLAYFGSPNDLKPKRCSQHQKEGDEGEPRCECTRLPAV